MLRLKELSYYLIVVIFLLFSLFLPSQALASKNQIEAEYEKLSQAVYNLDFNQSELERSLVNLTKQAEELTDLAKSYYWQGQISILQAKTVADSNLVKQLEKSQRLFELAIVEDKEFAEAYLALAEVYMDLLENRGVFFAIRNGPKVLELLEEASSLKDSQAIDNAFGRAYLEAPKIGGGSAEKALDYLLQALKKADEQKSVVNFKTYHYLARTYLALEQKSEAVKYNKLALEIFAKNKEANDLL